MSAITSRILIKRVSLRYSVDMSTYMYMHIHTSLLHSRDIQTGFRGFQLIAEVLQYEVLSLHFFLAKHFSYHTTLV